MRDLPALPVAILFATAAVALSAWRRQRAQRALALCGCTALLVVAVVLVIAVADGGVLVTAIGGWSAPVGIELRADMLGALMVLVTAVLGLAVVVFGIAETPRRHEESGHWPLTLLLLAGVCGAFLTADLFNLFVWFEVMLIASFVLLALGGSRAELHGALVYLALNMVSSFLFLTSVGLVYGATRSLDFATLSVRLAELGVERPHIALAIQGLLLVSFGIKAAVFPLFFWLPASYHTPPSGVSALFAGLLTKVGVYALLRATLEIFASPPIVFDVLAAVAIATMLVGVLGALAQVEVRRVLGFHIVSQIGYMVAGIALATGTMRRAAVAATVFYVLHHIVVKANLFLIAGVVRRVRGSEVLDDSGGLARSHPWLALLFLVPALSLAGVPPLSGFWAKLAIIEAGLGAGRKVLVAVAVVTGLLTLASMVKIWVGVFAGEERHADRPPPLTRREATCLYAPIAALAALTLAIGLAPAALYRLASIAADHVLIHAETP